MLNKKVIFSLKCIYPYILLLLVTCLANYFVFYKGIASGDDIRFHLFQINDLLYGFRHGYFSLSTNHLFMGGFAIYNYGFYGPVPHYMAAMIAFFFGQSAEFGYKAVIILSSFIGGIFFYKLARKMSNNYHIATIAGCLFILIPYRIFCAACRCAFAEVVAMCFIPLIFYGLYSIIHDEEYRVGPYISLVIGAATVIMSHPFTGMMCGLFGALYLVFNIHTFIKNKKSFLRWPSMITSVVLIVCLISFYFFNALTTTQAGIYRLNDNVIQWTNYEHVADSTQLSAHFSGFLNFIYISNNSGAPGWNVENVSSIIVSIMILCVSFINVVICDSLVRKAPKNNYYRWAVDGIAAFMFPLIFGVRIEIFFAIIIFYVTYVVFSYFYNVELYENSPKINQIKNNPDFYFALVSLFISLIMIFIPGVWKVLPSVFYQAQFAWRMWSLAMFFGAMLITLLVSYMQRYRGAVVAFACLSAILLSLSQGLIEKRIYYNNDGEVYYNVDFAYVMENSRARYSGAQNEMVPLILMQDDYKSEYSNSLYPKVRNAITHWYYEKNPFIYSLEDYEKYNPVFLEGSGDIKITKYDSPNNSFDVNITSKTALIQFPQIYNNTYEVYSSGKLLGEAKNVDGLIAFELEEGNYSIDLKFVNSKAYRVAQPFFYIGLGALVPFAIIGTYYQYKCKRNKKEES